MPHKVLLYGKASQQRIAPYIVISKRRRSTQEQKVTSSQSSIEPQEIEKEREVQGLRALYYGLV